MGSCLRFSRALFSAAPFSEIAVVGKRRARKPCSRNRRARKPCSRKPCFGTTIPAVNCRMRRGGKETRGDVDQGAGRAGTRAFAGGRTRGGPPGPSRQSCRGYPSVDRSPVITMHSAGASGFSSKDLATVASKGVLVTVVDGSRVAMTPSLVLAPRNLAAHREAMVHLHR